MGRLFNPFVHRISAPVDGGEEVLNCFSFLAGYRKTGH